MLFFFFYMAAGEALQILAGNILISRGWRWSKSRNVWIAKADGMQPEFQSRTSESGFYQVRLKEGVKLYSKCGVLILIQFVR